MVLRSLSGIFQSEDLQFGGFAPAATNGDNSLLIATYQEHGRHSVDEELAERTVSDGELPHIEEEVFSTGQHQLCILRDGHARNLSKRESM
jgi:hypothetical protein